MGGMLRRPARVLPSILIASLFLAAAPPQVLGGSPFVRGDLDGDGEATLADAIYVFAWKFTGEASPPACAEAADANNDGAIDISDGISIFSFLFLGTAAPPPPGAPPAACGVDPDRPGSPGDLGCEAYSRCSVR
jgi:hypothetical protein